MKLPPQNKTISQKFDPARVKSLNELYVFYRYQDDQKRPLGGQFFAVKKGKPHSPSTNGTDVYEAVVKKVDRPNPEVGRGVLNSAFIEQYTPVGSLDPAGLVAVRHPALIAFLLEQE